MGAFVQFIIALAKLIPAIIDACDKAVALYTQARIAQMKQEYRDGIKTALAAQDQRDLEHAIGDPNAGQPSGLGGTEIRDTLPGVKP